MSRIFTDVSETHTLLTNLFKSLCRSDQDTWLREHKLARIGGYGSTARIGSARTIASTCEGGGSGGTPQSLTIEGIPTADEEQPQQQQQQQDERPTRGYSNVAALIAEASPSKQRARDGQAIHKKLDVGSQPRISQALRLAGESHTIEEETKRIPIVNIDTDHGIAAHNNDMQTWFSEVIEKQNNGNTTYLTLENAKNEYLRQQHFGAPNPEKEFYRHVANYAPVAQSRGGLNAEEFAVIFARFDYD